MKDAWIQALSRMTYGIYVLTSYHGETINGMIASWVSQVSYDPPLIMVAVHPNRYSHHLIKQSGCFVLNALSRNQGDLLNRFKGPDPMKKFASVRWHQGITGCPILDDCIAYLECEVTTRLSPGNHTLFIGEILDAQVFSSEESLSTMDYDGVYLGRS